MKNQNKILSKFLKTRDEYWEAWKQYQKAQNDKFELRRSVDEYWRAWEKYRKAQDEFQKNRKV